MYAAGCRHFFVATLGEGIALRTLLPQGEIFVLAGPQAGEGADYVASSLVPVLNSLPQIDVWNRWCRADGAAPAVLHIDTGMSRLGLSPSELEAILADPKPLLGFDLPIVMSHLASADIAGSSQSVEQKDRFRAALDRLLPLLPKRPMISFANSSGIFSAASTAST